LFVARLVVIGAGEEGVKKQVFVLIFFLHKKAVYEF
jgi:hypothetical protein